MNISQAAKLSGLSTKQIRDYEKAGLLPQPPRTEAGYRIYPASTVEQLKFIHNARQVGFSLAQIKTLLQLRENPQRASRDVKQLTAEHITELEQKIAHLQTMLTQLRQWHHGCRGNDSPDCPILQGLNDPLQKITQK